MQQIFGARVTLDWTQYNKVYKINAFYTEMFTFLYAVVTWFQCPKEALNVTYSNLFSNQWAFIMLETEVFNFQYNFLNFYIAKTMQCILLKFVQLTLNKQ